MISFARIRYDVLLGVVGLYLILNHGFMQLRIPPTTGGGVPVGELTLLIAFLTFNHLVVLSRLHATVYLAPFILWWGFGLGRAMLAVPEYGMWALRDASHVIDSLFLVIGFAIMSRPEYLDRFFAWIPKLLLVGCAYALLFPFRETLEGYSPTIRSGAGYDTPIFFKFGSSFVVLPLAAAWLTLFRERSKWTVAIEIALVGYAVILLQARTTYLQLVALAAFFIWFRPRVFGKSVLGLVVVIFALLALPVLGIEIEGRLGQKASLEFLINHLLSIGGVEGEGVVGSAQGVSLRFGWWASIFDRLLSGFDKFIIGLGFGFPLTDFITPNQVVAREPHNSYISVVARMGLIGAVAFVWMHIVLLRSWYRAYRVSVQYRWRDGQNRLLFLMVFFILIWVFALAEDALERPYFAIPHYFFWGIALRMAWFLKHRPEALVPQPRPIAAGPAPAHSAPGRGPQPTSRRPRR